MNMTKSKPNWTKRLNVATACMWALLAVFQGLDGNVALCCLYVTVACLYITTALLYHHCSACYPDEALNHVNLVTPNDKAQRPGSPDAGHT